MVKFIREHTKPSADFDTAVFKNVYSDVHAIPFAFHKLGRRAMYEDTKARTLLHCCTETYDLGTYRENSTRKQKSTRPYMSVQFIEDFVLVQEQIVLEVFTVIQMGSARRHRSSWSEKR